MPPKSTFIKELLDTLLKGQLSASSSRFVELYQIATWADQVKRSNTYQWSYPLHYQDLPNDPLHGICTTDIHQGCSQGCVSKAIMNYTHILEDHTRSKKEYAKISGAFYRRYSSAFTR
jgi:hypothetical protein